MSRTADSVPSEEWHQRVWPQLLGHLPERAHILGYTFGGCYNDSVLPHWLEGTRMV